MQDGHGDIVAAAPCIHIHTPSPHLVSTLKPLFYVFFVCVFRPHRASDRMACAFTHCPWTVCLCVHTECSCAPHLAFSTLTLLFYLFFVFLSTQGTWQHICVFIPRSDVHTHTAPHVPLELFVPVRTPNCLPLCATPGVFHTHTSLLCVFCEFIHTGYMTTRLCLHT